ncbi:MAG: hypothetical protein ACXADY_06925 [Candidatus Hodarchaeales archaeon]|jgi:hypothetical protein
MTYEIPRKIEDRLQQIKKLEKKKKWEDASRASVELAEYYIGKKNFTEGLKHLEKAISAQKKEKKAEKVIVLYRKIISFAKKGKNKTKKELFRYSVSAIPLIEAYIQVLREDNRYISKHGAMTLYFLGECREIVSGLTQRNDEFLRAGHIFLEVGKKLGSTKKTEKEADESFDKARTIFDMMNNKEETFEALLVEAEINVRKYRLERGFLLFDDARGLFEDDTHQSKVVDSEKIVYAEMGLQLLQNHFTDTEKYNIADMLISKSKEAHLLAKSLDQVPGILFEIGKINIENKKLENGFSSFDEAITNSQLVGDEVIPKKIIEYLFQEGKKLSENLIERSIKIELRDDVSNLPLMTFFEKINEICKKLDRGQEVEEVALYIWQLGLDLLEQKVISDDSPFIEKAVAFFINNGRFSSLHIITDVLEKRLEEFAELKKIDQMQSLKTFLVNSYTRIDDYQSAGFLNVKIAQIFASWGNYEKQVACLREATSLLLNADQDTVKTFSEAINEQFTQMELYVPDSIHTEVLHLLGNAYLQLKDDDKYDSLFASFALKSIENNDFSKAMEYHRQDFEFLVRTKNFSRALARVEEFSNNLLSKGKYQLVNNLRSKQLKLLIETKSSQVQVLQTIKSLEDQITEAFAQKVDIAQVNDTFNHIIHLYDYLGLKEAQGDAMFEMANRLFEMENLDPGFEYLNRAYEQFKAENAVEKYGLLLDLAFKKKNYYQDLTVQETADRFLDFLIATLKELGQIKEAAELIMSRAVQFIPINETKAFDQFEKAKKLILETQSSEEVLQFYQDFGSALLKAGKIDEGMENLTKAESSTSTGYLAIADTCLTVAKDRFSVKDYDTYFELIDRALSIYTDQEMFQESSSIALAEARKLWSVDNLPYTMIFLERAWAPLSITYDEKLSQSIQPLLQVAEEFIATLFDQKRYDEAKNFLEFQERIYKQLNLTDKILEVEIRKIDALIGRGNIEGALSQIYDITTTGIEELKFKETRDIVSELLPIFIETAPREAKELLKIFLSLLISMEPTKMTQKFVRETLDYYINLITDTLIKKGLNLFQEQTTLFIDALTEVAEAEDVLAYFITSFSQKIFRTGERSQLFPVLNMNLANLQPSKPEIIMKIVYEISLILEAHEASQQTIIDGLDFLDGLTLNLDDKSREFVSSIFLKMEKKFRSQKEIHDHAGQLILKQSKQIIDAPTTLLVLHGLIEEDLEIEDYENALRRLDDAIGKLEQAPRIIANQYSDLLDRFLIELDKKKKKEWSDLLMTKHQIIRDRFLNEGD